MSRLQGMMTFVSFVFIFLGYVFSYAAASYISPIPSVQATKTTAAAGLVLPRATESFTAVSSCSENGTSVFCLYDATELQVIVPATATGEIPPAYTGCHKHGSESFCFAPDGSEVEVLGLGGAEGNLGEGGHSEGNGGGEDCHFHAGVEHCVGEESASGTAECSRRDREYNIPLRIGLLFVILATSFIGVAGPICLKPVLSRKYQTIFVVLKQFGTGVIIATAFVHLLTHAQLMFTNECLGELEYEATAAAIVMGGLFFAFVVENTSHRVAQKLSAGTQYNDEVVGVAVLEAGIIFHSILVGITLVVAGDSFFVTLFVVILFHQMFEGLALGTRIASIGLHVQADGSNTNSSLATPVGDHSLDGQDLAITDTRNSTTANKGPQSLSLSKKLLMAAAFAVTTPVGMAIGIGALKRFNGNDPSTLIALGTLDALSAGILIWVGVVEMWAGDWMFGGELTDASLMTTLLGGFGLVAGMVLMSLLGKWA
ncbi:Zip-domain-containing protein [Hypoxylon sp. NC0597]|nr:Zip-domain-containing protein [Hypoxylon sp. NC0597]